MFVKYTPNTNYVGPSGKKNDFTLYTSKKCYLVSLLGIILKRVLTGMYCYCKSYYNVNVMIMKE